MCTRGGIVVSFSLTDEVLLAMVGTRNITSSLVGERSVCCAPVPALCSRVLEGAAACRSELDGRGVSIVVAAVNELQ